MDILLHEDGLAQLKAGDAEFFRFDLPGDPRVEVALWKLIVDHGPQGACPAVENGKLVGVVAPPRVMRSITRETIRRYGMPPEGSPAFRSLMRLACAYADEIAATESTRIKRTPVPREPGGTS